MELIVKISGSELMKLPIIPLVEMTQPGWKTFSCKRRINEYCDEAGWKMLEETIKEARTLYELSIHQNKIDFDIMRWNRIKELIPWAANIVHYGTTGIKS